MASQVLPRFGTTPLVKISEGAVRSWVAEMPATGLSPAPVRKQCSHCASAWPPRSAHLLSLMMCRPGTSKASALVGVRFGRVGLSGLEPLTSALSEHLGLSRFSVAKPEPPLPSLTKPCASCTPSQCFEGSGVPLAPSLRPLSSSPDRRPDACTPFWWERQYHRVGWYRRSRTETNETTT